MIKTFENFENDDLTLKLSVYIAKKLKEISREIYGSSIVDSVSDRKDRDFKVISIKNSNDTRRRNVLIKDKLENMNKMSNFLKRIDKFLETLKELDITRNAIYYSEDDKFITIEIYIYEDYITDNDTLKNYFKSTKTVNKFKL